MMRRTFLAGLASSALAAAPTRSKLGIATTSFWIRRPKDTIEFLVYCDSLGAAGIQASLSSLDGAYLQKLRQETERRGMYLEVMAPLRSGFAIGFGCR